MRPLFAALIALCLSPLPASADDPMRGFGVHTCSEYFDLYNKNKDMADTVFGSWAMGFMSATNVSLMSQQKRYHDLGGMPLEDQMTKVRDYCTAHPKDDFWQAVIELYNSLPVKPM